MNWWTVVLIISGFWSLIGFVTVIINFKFIKLKLVVRKIIYYHLKTLPHNIILYNNISESSSKDNFLVTKDKNIDNSLLFLKFKYEVTVANQNQQQMVNWITNIKYCHLFNHKHHHHFTVTNILNHDVKHHINLLKPLYCLKQLFDNCFNKMSNVKHCPKPTVENKEIITEFNNYYEHRFNKKNINNIPLTKPNCQLQSVHNIIDLVFNY